MCPFGRRRLLSLREGEAASFLASVGRGKAELFPLQGIDGENSRADDSACLTVPKIITEMEMLS